MPNPAGFWIEPVNPAPGSVDPSPGIFGDA
jgi:hypothetical protein